MVSGVCFVNSRQVQLIPVYFLPTTMHMVLGMMVVVVVVSVRVWGVVVVLLLLAQIFVLEFEQANLRQTGIKRIKGHTPSTSQHFNARLKST